ncbi:MAG: ATP-binding cassette domain-containing protein, partial [Bacilli bacterium]|nr:ATP-binding cassette domain-containing protein [Bacilli bacterium]
MVIQLKHVKKIYNKNGIEVVKDFNLTIDDKEFVVFVGPSGCGKSTTLRMIAGLEDITKGEITFDGKVMNNVSPGERNVAMVFQSYALYPNMSVYKNMEFPLKMKKVPKPEREIRIMRAAKMLGLTDFLERKPKNLSGGQRQRVALGREIVRDVDLFLMDEPLSNLDAKLRVQMRSEITKLHKKL